MLCNNAMLPVISIVVATRNAENTIHRLLQSLCEQSFKQFELVVQDAKSTDSTLAMIGDSERHIQVINLVSEDDSGIYDAWNKAVARARGQWLLFLGADDELADQDVLQKASNHLCMLSDEIEFCAGSVKMLDQSGNCLLYSQPNLSGGRSQLKYIAPVAFTGVFIRKRIAVCNPFDTSLKISGDYDFLCRTWKDDVAVQLSFDVCKMLEGGISSNPANQFFATWENTRIVSRYFDHVWEFRRAKMLVKSGLVSTVFHLFGSNTGKKLLDSIRRLRGLPPCWKK